MVWDIFVHMAVHFRRSETPLMEWNQISWIIGDQSDWNEKKNDMISQWKHIQMKSSYPLFGFFINHAGYYLF
jgi:hypothetical protein